MIDYVDHTGPDGTSDNLGGMTQRLWVIPKRDLATIVAVKDLGDPSVITEDEWAVIIGDHIPKAGKGFVELYNHMDKGSFEASVQGERGGSSYKMVGKGFYPGMDPVILGMFRKSKNDQFIGILEKLNGDQIQAGSDRLSAYLTAVKITTATNSSGICGVDYEIEWMESGPTMYEGAIILHP